MAIPRRAGPQPGEKCRVRRYASSAILNLPSLNRHCAKPSLTSGGAFGCICSACTLRTVLPHAHHEALLGCAQQLHGMSDVAQLLSAPLDGIPVMTMCIDASHDRAFCIILLPQQWGATAHVVYNLRCQVLKRNYTCETALCQQ